MACRRTEEVEGGRGERLAQQDAQSDAQPDTPPTNSQGPMQASLHTLATPLLLVGALATYWWAVPMPPRSLTGEISDR